MLAGGCSGQGFFFPASCLGGVGSAGRLRSRFCQFGDSWRELQGGRPVFWLQTETAVANSVLLSLTSNQVGVPAELKHINKRRKRNQPGLPQ